MASTTRNMWKVVYDRKCGVVVMLSDLLEDGMVRYDTNTLHFHASIKTSGMLLLLVYHHPPSKILILCTTSLLYQESCFQYWPALGQSAEFGEYTVKLISEEPLEGFAIRTMSVLHKKVL